MKGILLLSVEKKVEKINKQQKKLAIDQKQIGRSFNFPNWKF